MVENNELSREEEPKERIARLQQKVWNNLRNSGLLQQILNRSDHAGGQSYGGQSEKDVDQNKYGGTRFWTEIGTDEDEGKPKMWLQIQIMPAQGYGQPVTPKLYRITNDPDEQRHLSEQIWEGITEDDLKFIARFKSEEYHARDQQQWLSPNQSQTIKILRPAFESGKFTIELIPDHAQYRIVAEK